MRFLADMGVDRRVVRWLQERNHDSVHLGDQGLQRLPDPQVFNKAYEERRIILTFDLDFGEIAAFSRGRVVSVVLFRLHNTRTAHVIDRLEPRFAFRKVLEKGAIVVVEESRCRVRHLPIGAHES
jgi:predicted nuclease of predicted toxin-antitoxin system